MARSSFHPLTVSRIEPLTPDAAAITFEVPAGLAARFAFAPGQWLTLRRLVAGRDERRSYSICAAAGRPLRIGVREVPGGALSGWLLRQVRPGDVIEVAEPAGSFTPDLGAPGHHVLLAAGSGITPMMSIAASLLAARDDIAVTLVYGNRRAGTVMFADEVADLKDAHPARMQVVHVLSREPQEAEVLHGRLDAAKLVRLLPALLDVAGVVHWWLCGPFGMTADAVTVLTGLGVPAGRIHRELFYVGDQPPEPARHEDTPVGPGSVVTVVLDGRSTPVTVPPGVPVLDAAQRVRPDLPFACKGGVCGTCRARLTHGEVRMRRNFALEPAELAAGFVLTCQSLPVSGEITVDYDT